MLMRKPKLFIGQSAPNLKKCFQKKLLLFLLLLDESGPEKNYQTNKARVLEKLKECEISELKKVILQAEKSSDINILQLNI